MSDNSKIEWTDATWQPITGCSIVSPGCTNCYAMRLAGTRLKDHPSRAGLTKCVNGNHVWTGEVRFNEQWLMQPLHWRKPRKIFVCAHGDLFHESVPDEWIDRVFAVMALAPQHTFMVLTKRASRMREYMTHVRFAGDTGTPIHPPVSLIRAAAAANIIGPSLKDARNLSLSEWPLPHVWLGVTAEDQARANERIPDLRATPAAKRFVSIEPMLGPIDLRRWLATANVMCKKCGASFWLHDANPCKHAGNGGWTLACPNCGDCKCVPTQEDRGDPVTWAPPASWKLKVVGRFDRVHPTISVKSGLDWVVCGGESGPGSRPMHPDWARSLRDQCKAAGVPFMFKQWGDWREPIDGESFDISHGRMGNPPSFIVDQGGGVNCFYPSNRQGCATMICVGKRRAGRLLDGEEHNGET